MGARWLRNPGGIAPIDIHKQPPGRHLCLAEREEIALLRAQGNGVRKIARAVGRDSRTISRELRLSAATRSGKVEQRASVAQWKADMVAGRPETPKLVANERLHAWVEEPLAGRICDPDGIPVKGPPPPGWMG